MAVDLATRRLVRVDGQLVVLFRPRTQEWTGHFEMRGDRVAGLTAIGVGTVELLNMNDDDRRKLRRESQRHL